MQALMGVCAGQGEGGGGRGEGPHWCMCVGGRVGRGESDVGMRIGGDRLPEDCGGAVRCVRMGGGGGVREGDDRG